MKQKFWIITLSIAFFCSFSQLEIAQMETGSQQPMPFEWVDKDTGHKIIRLSRIEGNSRSFYFHNNPFVPALANEGDKMVFYNNQEQPQSDRRYRKEKEDSFSQ